MIKMNRSFPKFREDIWVNLNGEFVLGKFIKYDTITHETVVQVNKKTIKLSPQIIPYK